MPIFRYEAADRQGQLRRGAMEASSEVEVRSRLVQMGFQPRTVIAPGDRSARKAAPPTSPAAPAQPSAPSGRQYAGLVTCSLSLSDQAVFWRQVADMARAGIGPFEIFQTLSTRGRNRHIRRAAADVAARVRGGSSVADAMAANGDVFGTEYRMAVLAGEKGGFVADVYMDIASELENEVRQRNFGRWVYWFLKPSVVVGAVIIHFLTVMLGKLGGFEQMMSGASDAERWRQYLVAETLTALRFEALVVFPAVALVVMGIPWLSSWLERGPLRPAVDGVLMSLPVVARVKRLRLLGRFYRMLRRLLAAGVSPIAAWDAAAGATANGPLVAALEKGRKPLSSGAGFGAALQATGIAPDADVQMMSTADRSGRVPEMLGTLASDYESRTHTASRLARIGSILLWSLLCAGVTIYPVYVAVAWYGRLAEGALGGPGNL